MRKKCYIYTLVSTAAQTEGYSLEAQTERLRKYADYKEMEVVREYCDAGKSGMSIKGRLAFMEMMDDISCEKDEISCVLVFKLSRFGRNAADILKSVQLLMDFDVDLVYVEDAIDSSTQGGRLTLAILSAVAEMEHENILHSDEVEQDFKSQNEFIICAINDYYERHISKKNDPYLETRVLSNLPAMLGLYAVKNNHSEDREE